MAKEVVLSKMAMKTVYSQNGDVAKDHNLYCSGFFGMYLLTGLALSANSIQLRWKSTKCIFSVSVKMILLDFYLRHSLGMQIHLPIGKSQ